MKLYKYRSLGIIGVLIAIVGWVVGNAEHFPTVYKIIVPEYSRSMDAFRMMHERGVILNKNITGVLEIADILEKKFKSTRNVPIEITQFKTLSFGTAFKNTDEGQKPFQYIDLELSFTNAPTIVERFYSLGDEIHDVYRNVSIFFWSTIIFWLGIIIAFFAIFVNPEKSARGYRDR